jgi:hypothetical protein
MVGGGTTGIAGFVAPGTLPVVFFRREVSFFGGTGIAGTVPAGSFAPAAAAATVVAEVGGGVCIGRGGNVMRTVSFLSVGLLAPAAGGVGSAIKFS